jgi:hypothetical protein
MNKLSASLLTAALAAAPIIGLAAPAVAGSDKVTICHATGADGKYVTQSVAKDGAANGHAGDTHQAGRDIIPAYSWLDGKTRRYFEGQNLELVSLIGTGCTAPAVDVIVSPAVAPAYVPASCARPDLPYGQVIIDPTPTEGIDGVPVPALNGDNTVWTVGYTLAAATEEAVYAWPAGTDGTYSFEVVPLTADPYYITDEKTGVGQCELPETGALMDALPWGAGAVGVGLLAFAASKLRRRTAQ